MEVDCETDPRRYAEEFKGHALTGTAYLEFRDVGELIRKYVKGKETLDYGCGHGRSTALLKSLGLNVNGVDVNEYLIKDAREQDVNGSYEVITSAKVSADDNTYDLVFSSWVMNSVSTKVELKKIGREIGRILKPNGILIMLVGNKDRYNKDWLTVNTEFPENRTLFSGSRVKSLLKNVNMIIHGYFWTEEDYREMVMGANMTVLEIHSPLGKDYDGYDWKLEKTVSPVHIYVVKKNA